MARRLRLYKCTNCGYEARLQAWKAECPSCRSGFTLVPIAEPESSTKTRPTGYIAPALAVLYLILTILYPGLTVAQILPSPLTQIILLAVIALSLTSSTVGNISAAAAGASLAIIQLASQGLSTPGEIAAAMILLGVTASSVANEASIRRVKTEA